MNTCYLSNDWLSERSLGIPLWAVNMLIGQVQNILFWNALYVTECLSWKRLELVMDKRQQHKARTNTKGFSNVWPLLN